MPASKDIHEHKICLKRLKLQDFKGFGNISLHFDKLLTVLIADNGGGKTTVLDAIGEFLRYFLEIGIEGKPREAYKPSLNNKHIKNDQLVSLCEVEFELSYKYPATEIFEFMNAITDYLNDYQLLGTQVILQFSDFYEEMESKEGLLSIEDREEEKWRLIVDGDTEVSLEEEFIQKLNNLSEEKITINPLTKNEESLRLLNPDDSFIVALKSNNVWQPNLDLSHQNVKNSILHSGVFKLKFEINQSGIKFIHAHDKNISKPDIFIKNLREDFAFIEDFCQSIANQGGSKGFISLPLLVYYGSDAFNTKPGNPSIKYQPQLFEAYKGALNPERFEFESFIEWFNSLSEEPSYIKNEVCKTILSTLNADEECYSELRVEKGELKLDKKTEKNGQATTLSIDQLSSGEQTLFALIGDLVKRAIELNLFLFKVDYEEGEGSYSSPLDFAHGIVLIDEIDLHLHPKWQRQIISVIRKTFPLVQFVVTTHSPLVLQNVDRKISKISNGNIIEGNLVSGWSIEDIFEDMGLGSKTNLYGFAYLKALYKFYEHCRNKEIDKAEKYLAKLMTYLAKENSFRIVLKNKFENLKEEW